MSTTLNNFTSVTTEDGSHRVNDSFQCFNYKDMILWTFFHKLGLSGLCILCHMVFKYFSWTKILHSCNYSKFLHFKIITNLFQNLPLKLSFFGHNTRKHSYRPMPSIYCLQGRMLQFAFYKKGQLTQFNVFWLTICMLSFCPTYFTLKEASYKARIIVSNGKTDRVISIDIVPALAGT